MALLMSRRARRMDQHHKRGNKNAALSLVSLMDIFTILVFFLLVNASEVEVLPSPKNIQLPESVSEKRPEETVVVMLAADHILVDGQQIISSEQLKQNGWNNVLKEHLSATLAAMPALIVEDEAAEALPPAITVMGDKSVPFSRVREVMKVCGAAGFGSVSLAVEKLETAIETSAPAASGATQ